MKVIAGEECVSQHRLLVGDIISIGATRKKRKMYTSLKVQKLREQSVRQEFARVVAESKNEILATENVE